MTDSYPIRRGRPCTGHRARVPRAARAPTGRRTARPPVPPGRPAARAPRRHPVSFDLPRVWTSRDGLPRVLTHFGLDRALASVFRTDPAGAAGAGPGGKPKITWKSAASCPSVIRIRRLTFHDAAEHHANRLCCALRDGAAPSRAVACTDTLTQGCRGRRLHQVVPVSPSGLVNPGPDHVRHGALYDTYVSSLSARHQIGARSRSPATKNLPSATVMKTKIIFDWVWTSCPARLSVVGGGGEDVVVCLTEVAG